MRRVYIYIYVYVTVSLFAKACCFVEGMKREREILFCNIGECCFNKRSDIRFSRIKFFRYLEYLRRIIISSILISIFHCFCFSILFPLRETKEEKDGFISIGGENCRSSLSNERISTLDKSVSRVIRWQRCQLSRPFFWYRSFPSSRFAGRND